MNKLLNLSGYDQKMVAIFAGAVILLILTGITYLIIINFLRKIAKRKESLLDDKIVSVIEHFILPILILLVVYFILYAFPVPLEFKDLGGKILFTAITVLISILIVRFSGLLLSILSEHYEVMRTIKSPISPLIMIMTSLLGTWVIVQKIVPKEGSMGNSIHTIMGVLLTKGFRVVLVVTTFFVLLHLVRLLSGKMRGVLEGLTPTIEQKKRAQTLDGIVRAVSTSLVVLIMTMFILRELGIDMTPIIATAGIGGLAIGFGAQSLVKDVISGFFILLEDQIRVGDVVSAGGKGGYVESVGLRIITLRDFDGSVHIVPNGCITTVTNMTKDFSYYLMDIGVSYKEDVDEVMAVLKDVGKNLREDPVYAPDILDDIEVVGVDNFADSAVIIKVRIKTLPIKQWYVGRELRRRIKKTFDARGIEIPFPHVTLFMGGPKKGVSAPLYIKRLDERAEKVEAKKDEKPNTIQE